jgi:hypothetical protein
MASLRSALVCGAVLALGAFGAPAAAQDAPGTAPALPSGDVVPTGWVFTPGLLYGATWDDNVLVAHRSDQQVGDLLNLVNPRGDLSYRGRLGRVDGHYDGAFLLYRQLNTLNSYDQHATIAADRALSTRTSISLQGAASHSPTTDVADLVAVPFVRTGATIERMRGGMQTRLTKRVSFAASLDLERVHFDANPQFAPLLRGGHGLDGTATLTRQLSAVTALVANYEMDRGWVGPQGAAFTVQNASIGIERRFEHARVSGQAGLSRLNASAFGPSHTGLNWRGELARIFGSAELDVAYSRDFATSYGFAGGLRSDDFGVHLKSRLSRRTYGQVGTSWRRSDPLTNSQLRFRSVWVDAALGVTLRPGLLAEAFWNGSTQTIDQPAGELGRNQFGVHVVATRPMRIH